ncbi:MAG: hypothetical protein ABI665_25630 [Vicinamibacterales bacterium]
MIVNAARVCAVLALVAGVSLPLAANSQAPAAAARANALDLVMQRAAATAPGTYVLNGTALAPSATAIPVLVQVDVLRGKEPLVRVPIVVGAELPQGAEIRLRVVTVAAAGQTSRVMGNATGSGAAGHARFVHEFVLPPGDYESQAAVGEFKTAAGVTAVLAKSKFTVPDVWGSALVVTPIVLGEEATAGRRGEMRPFSFGPTTIVPAVKGQFPQGGAIRVAFRIFNWRAKDEEKPDVTVEYLFYEQGTKRLNLFNKIKPQLLTASTLGDAFDPASGILNAGMVVPLGSFTFGDFKLKVSVTDNRSKQSTEQWVGFTVSP